MLYAFCFFCEWNGFPKPHLQRFRLAAGVLFLLETDMPVSKRSVYFWRNLDLYLCVMFMHIFENLKQTRNVITCRLMVDLIF